MTETVSEVPPGAGSITLDKGDDDASVSILTPKDAPTPPVTPEPKKEVAPPPPPETNEEEIDETETKDEVEDEDEEEELSPEDKQVDKTADAKSIKEKYPNFFKEFPQVRDALYRANRMSAIFPSVEAAEVAAGKIEGYDVLSDHLSQGNSLPLLIALSQEEGGNKKVEALVDNFIPTLFKASEPLYKRAVEPILKNLINMAYSQGEAEGNSDLKNAASHFAKMLWNKFDIPEAVKMGPIEQPKEDPEKLSLQNRISSEFRSDIENRSRGVLRSEIRKVIDAVDPDGVYPDRIKMAMLKDIEGEIDYTLANDEEHMRAMDVAWKNAKREGLAAHWKPRIANAWLGRAKNLLPAIRDRLLSDVQKASGGRTPEKDNQPKEPQKKHIPAGSGLPASKASSKGSITVDQAKKAGMSDMDIIMRTAGS